MRVALVSCHSGHVGGVETYLQTLVPAMQSRGHEVAAWYEEELASDSVSRLDFPRFSFAGHTNHIAALESLKTWNPDVLYVHGLRSLGLERVMLNVAPAVFFAHSFYGTCISGSKSHAFPRPATCERAFGPACLAHFYPRRCGGLNPISTIRQYRHQQARLQMLGRYATILVASTYMAHEYERNGLASKVRVVALPVTPRNSVAVRDVPDNSVRLLYLGRLEITKGVHLLLDSVARVAGSVASPVVLEIAGAGSLRTSLENQATLLMRGRSNLFCRFHGHIDPADCDALIAQSHLLLVPSCWPEPFGLVGLEAARLGLPAVAFAVGGIRDWLVDGQTGVLVPQGARAAERFAAAIVRCVANPAQLKEMGARARALAARFTVTRHVEQLEVVLEAASNSRIQLRA